MCLLGRVSLHFCPRTILFLKMLMFIRLTFFRDSNGHKHAVKTIFPAEFEYQLELQAPLKYCPYVRAVQDKVEEHGLFIFDYRTDNLLQASLRKDLTLPMRRKILRDALRGLAELHSRGIVHTGKYPVKVFEIRDRFTNAVSGCQAGQYSP